MRLLTLAALASALALSASALAQPQAAPRMPVTVAPLPPAGTATFIRHGKVFTLGLMGTLGDGDVLIAGGKIVAVGPNLVAPAGARVIDARGKWVTPGLLASYTQLGIMEIELVADSNDGGPGLKLSGDADDTAGPSHDEAAGTAAFDVVDALNPASTLIPIARIAGVTRSLTAPTLSRGVFSGHAAVIHLGNGSDDLVKMHAGMVVNLEPASGGGAPTRPVLWSKFRETLDDAREYWAQRAGYRRPGGARDQASARTDLEALGPVVRGEEPLIVHVNRAADIRRVVAYAVANKLKLVILGADEGWMAAKELADAHVPVIVDADRNLPVTFSSLGATLKNAARMDAAGVTVLFMPQDDDPSQYARTITQIAGNAVANGMRWDHALAAITSRPAEVWGIAASYGTLEAGKDADVVVWDGDPLDVTSAPTAVFIQGAAIPLVSRQTMLRDRYRNLKDKSKPFAYR